jgi:hypothetical protein
MQKKWEKKYHVKSSIPAKEGQFHLFIGRWQSPNGLHEGHKALFQQVIDEGGRVLIAIRDGQMDEKNPLMVAEVYDNIRQAYSGLMELDIVRVIVLPDICSVDFGRGVGYDIIEHIPPPEIAEISATKIRESLNKG